MGIIEALLALVLTFGSGYGYRWATEDKIQVNISEEVTYYEPMVCIEEAPEEECVETEKFPKPWIIVASDEFVKYDSRFRGCSEVVKQVMDKLD
mgnify:CR=1 FL=1